MNTTTIYRNITAVDADGDTYKTMESHEAPVITFKPISDEIALQLIAFVNQRNLGKSITIDGKTYTLDHISIGKSAFWKSRSYSVYFRVGRSVVRISDHWSETTHHPRSQKLNCGAIRSAYWVLADKSRQTLESTYQSGQYPWALKAGIAGLTALNKSVDHWV